MLRDRLRDRLCLLELVTLSPGLEHRLRFLMLRERLLEPLIELVVFGSLRLAGERRVGAGLRGHAPAEPVECHPRPPQVAERSITPASAKARRRSASASSTVAWNRRIASRSSRAPRTSWTCLPEKSRSSPARFTTYFTTLRSTSSRSRSLIGLHSSLCDPAAAAGERRRPWRVRPRAGSDSRFGRAGATPRGSLQPRSATRRHAGLCAWLTWLPYGPWPECTCRASGGSTNKSRIAPAGRSRTGGRAGGEGC